MTSVELKFSEALSVGAPKNLSDNQRTDFLGGSMGQLVTADIWGKFGEFCRRGWVFSARVAAAAAVPISTTLTNAPSIWNPAGSGKLVVPLRIILSLGAIGTPILQGFTLSFLTGAGSVEATGAPVITWTNVAPVCLSVGAAKVATTRFAPAVSTYTVNPAALMDLGFGHLLEGAAASGQLYSQFMHDFDGSVLLWPGSTLHFGSTIATSTTYWTTIVFAEIPALAMV
ncbi:MAG TPA: hypothetical protein VJ553_05400 [Candidatus Paceibacterota bacterium]|nr:hypothetical protein [Candidatus Paceibacterota bacterium]